MAEMLLFEFIKALDLNNPDLPTINELNINIAAGSGSKPCSALDVATVLPFISIDKVDVQLGLIKNKQYRRLVVNVDATMVRVNNVTNTIKLDIYTRRLPQHPPEYRR